MKLLQNGKTGTNGLDYFDICTDNFKTQFGYIQKQVDNWKLYININGVKHYFTGKIQDCLTKAEELSKRTF